MTSYCFPVAEVGIATRTCYPTFGDCRSSLLDRALRCLHDAANRYIFGGHCPRHGERLLREPRQHLARRRLDEESHAQFVKYRYRVVPMDNLLDIENQVFAHSRRVTHHSRSAIAHIERLRRMEFDRE